MEPADYLKDIRDIKEMMNRSSQFISLSGLSGVLAGMYALAGAYVANAIIENHNEQTNRGYVTFESDTFKWIMLTAMAVLVLSIGTAFILTWFKAKKEGEKVWNNIPKRMIVNFLIPLITGGMFALLLLRNGDYQLVGPVMLIFYGLSCVSASKYTFRDVRYLGITVIILGLTATSFSGYGLEFWALGFGVCHIIYGGIMHFKYDRNP
jgi:hypothetical protein